MNDWDIKTILLGYDGSEGAERAARLASVLARQNKARILVITTFHWSPPGHKGSPKTPGPGRYR
jgi:nucleotide-binding universal stress UspA family protein